MKTAPADLLARLRPIGQEHLLAFWDRLTAAEQETLAAQVTAIDPALYRQLAEIAATPRDEHADLLALARRAEPPQAIRLDGRGAPFTPDQARAAGEAALRDGQLGLILVAGGLGTRLGFDQPKGMLPLGPLSQRTLFEIFIDQLRAVATRYGVRIPLCVMTSPATHDVTATFLAQRQCFGLPAEDVRLFCQATLWALDAQSRRILLDSCGSLFLGPDGHGGMLAALDRSGCLADAQRRGVRHLYYGQIDNPLLNVCDPLVVGAHVLAGSEMTTLAIAKRDPAERVGNVVVIDGRTRVIEYIHFPREQAEVRNADGGLRLWAGNTAVHVLDAAFLQRMAGRSDVLPMHPSLKAAPYVNEAGERVTPDKPNAWRFERFIFDLLPEARQALVVEADRRESFAPVKNADSEPHDTPRTARQAMVARATRMLAAAGAEVAPGVAVEINPRFALDAAELRDRLPSGLRVTRPTYFGPDGPQSF